MTATAASLRADAGRVDSSRLVFVAGLHRSGTTPLARLLAGHPEISGFSDTGVKEDEGQHLQRVYPPARDHGGAGRFALDARSHLTELSPLANPVNAERLLESWMPHWDLDRRLLVEKSPPNLVMTRFLQALFPAARFVVVVRHPVVVSLSTQKWAGPLTGLGDLLDHWCRAHETFLEDAAHLDRLHVVRYERLIADPSREMAGVARFLELEQPIDTSGVDAARSGAYLSTWHDLTHSHAPVTRRRMDHLRQRYADRLADHGYDFDDLARVDDAPAWEGCEVQPAPARRRAGAPLRVLYVGGMPRSGSTLTDLMLHQLPGNVGVGELFYLWRNGLAHDGLCACGERFTACDFWGEVGRVAFGGWDQIDVAQVLALQARVDRTSQIPWVVSRVRPPRFAADLRAYTDLLRRLYAAIGEVSGEPVVVDSSKRPSLAWILRGMPEVDLRVVQVVRDPRGVAFSFAKHVQLPEGAALRDEMPRSSTRRVGRRWVTVNALVGLLGRAGVPLVRIRYEDLVSRPERELRRVLELAGEDATCAAAFAHLTDDGIVVPRTHVVAGGRIRLVDGTMPLRLDEQWRRDMPGRSRRLISALTTPSRRRYGYP